MQSDYQIDIKQNHLLREKPPYRIPTMEEIKQIPLHNYQVVSLFSGCGGSCLGFRMAGFRVLWANEFDKKAAAAYQLNHPQAILDQRSIREISAEEILLAIKLSKGDLDILEGSPPCTSFSMSGKRDKNWGKTVKYGDGEQRVDDLFFEYIRLLNGLQPKVFVAENVVGLVRGRAKGYFKQILKKLREAGYIVEAKILDASRLGVPQVRRRVIIIGVRNDIGIKPCFPVPLNYVYTVKDGLFCLEEEIVKPNISVNMLHSWYLLKRGHGSQRHFNIKRTCLNKPCNTIIGISSILHPEEPRKFTISELKSLCSFPADFQLTGSFQDQWRRLGLAVPPMMVHHIAKVIKGKMLDQIENI